MQPMFRRASAALLGAAVLAGSFATSVAAVDPEPSDLHVFLNAPNGLQEHHPFSLTVQVNTASGDYETDATLDFDSDNGGASVTPSRSRGTSARSTTRRGPTTTS